MESLPIWERGLKLIHKRIQLRPFLSLPIWERGLKLGSFGPLGIIHRVAPYMGAWIEIFAVDVAIAADSGRSLYGSVD